MPTPPDRYRLLLEPLATGRWVGHPGSMRLRLALKVLLRSFGLRAVEVVREAGEPEKAAS